MNLNSFPIHQIGHDDHDNDHHGPIFGPNSSSPLSSCHIFFNSSQDHMIGCYDDHDRHQLYRPQHNTDTNNYDYFGGSTMYGIKNEGTEGRGLKLTLWEKDEDHDITTATTTTTTTTTNNPVKWMSSKMKLVQKMKKYPDHTAMQITSAKFNEDDHDETDLSSNSASSCYNNSPIRVCADCNTTKTPLWRSGPRGPKSLCNACGIRQRKARRAMAAAAAAANGVAEPPLVKIKVQHKEKAGKINGNASQIKKRCKTTGVAAASLAVGSTTQKKIGVEDFLINLSKSLSFQRVFPEDEKDAAILLMALSSGLVHG